MSRREWLKLKQEYLSLQKISMAHMKQTLRENPVDKTTPLQQQSNLQSQPEVSQGSKLPRQWS